MRPPPAPGKTRRNMQLNTLCHRKLNIKYFRMTWKYSHKSFAVVNQLLTSRPPDGDHNQQAVFVFTVSHCDASEDLPRPGHLLQSWQHHPEGRQGGAGVHYIHGAIKDEVPARASIDCWTETQLSSKLCASYSMWPCLKYFHLPPEGSVWYMVRKGVMICLHQQREPKVLKLKRNSTTFSIACSHTHQMLLHLFIFISIFYIFFLISALIIYYLPDEWSEQNNRSVGQRCHRWLGQHDPRQHAAPKTVEHGAEPAGQGADPGHLQSSCARTEMV